MNYDWRLEMDDDERRHACAFCNNHYYEMGFGPSCHITKELIEYPAVPNDCQNWEWHYYCHGFGMTGSAKKKETIQLDLFENHD